MQSYCPRCGKPRHIVGGRVVTWCEVKLSRTGDGMVEIPRPVLEGKCEICGTMLHRRPLAVA